MTTTRITAVRKLHQQSLLMPRCPANKASAIESIRTRKRIHKGNEFDSWAVAVAFGSRGILYDEGSMGWPFQPAEAKGLEELGMGNFGKIGALRKAELD
jgi:hypothetical protein